MSHTFTVKYVSGAYLTSTVKGQRASSTMDALMAAERLADKVLGPGKFELTALPAKPNMPTTVYFYEMRARGR